jgi:hypothetical protein
LRIEDSVNGGIRGGRGAIITYRIGVGDICAGCL